MFKSKIPQKQGFTLIELLVVIAILGTLLAMLMAAVQKTREASQLLQCTNNLRQIGIAAHNYHDLFRQFPAGMRYTNGTDPYRMMSWLTQMLPYIDQQSLWLTTQAAYAQSPSPFKDPPHVGLATVIPTFICPSDPRADQPQLAQRELIRVALTSYLGVEGRDVRARDGVLFRDSAISIQSIADGTSQTLFAGERPASADCQFGWWYAGTGQNFTGSADMVLGVEEINVALSIQVSGCPAGPYKFGPGSLANECDLFHFWSLHAGGANFMFADGSVHFLSYSASSVLTGLASRAGGELVTLPD